MSSSDHDFTVHLQDVPKAAVTVYRDIGMSHANWLSIYLNTCEVTIFCRTKNEVSDLAHQIGRQLMQDLFTNACKEIDHANDLRGKLPKDTPVQDMSVPPTDWSDIQTATPEDRKAEDTLVESK